MDTPKEADEEETFSDNFWQSMYRLPNLTEEVFTGLLALLFARCSTGTSQRLGHKSLKLSNYKN